MYFLNLKISKINYVVAKTDSIDDQQDISLCLCQIKSSDMQKYNVIVSLLPYYTLLFSKI